MLILALLLRAFQPPFSRRLFSPCEIVSRSVFCRCAGAEAKAQSFSILYGPIKVGP